MAQPRIDPKLLRAVKFLSARYGELLSDLNYGEQEDLGALAVALLGDKRIGRESVIGVLDGWVYRVLNEARSGDPMLCPACGKCRNFNYAPTCTCVVFTLGRVEQSESNDTQPRKEPPP